MSSASDVQLESVVKTFDGVTAVNGISLEIPAGSFFALLGPSGCGKTTTLRMIGGFEEPDEGSILLGGKDVVGLPPHKRDVNTVFQSYALFPHLSIHENVAFGLRRKGIKGSELQRRVAEILRRVGLEDFGSRKPRQLSGGQQQRVALARALVNGPQVLLLDEPLGALDLKLRKQLQLELKALQHDLGITFVHVTHDQEEAMTMADTIAVMNGGRVEQLGEPAELYDRPRTEFVAGFLGVSNLLRGTVTGPDRVRIEAGDELSVPLAGRTGDVAIGVRPEKFRLGPPLEGENTLSGTVKETAYVGVATQYIVTTGAGDIVVYAQNRDGGRPLRARVRRAAQLEPRIDVRPRPPSAEGDCGMNRSLTRKQLLERAALGGAALTLPGFLAACGGGGGETAAATTAAGGTQAARRRAPVLELAALHRRRREDEEAADARAVHEGDGRQGRLLRGHQRQRLVLRQDPAPARRRASRSTATSSSSPTTRASPGS